LGVKLGAPVHLFRLPAIYGPGRSALDQVRAGTARRVDKPGQVFSRIHVADIAAAVLASMERPAAQPGCVYNVADDEPAPQADVIALAATLLGLPVPPLIVWNEAASALGDMARSFYAESRRVRAERIKRELGVVLKYPSYRQGLRAIAAP
jgi:nucleoside-diphosphate-sugar epimerase